MNQKEAVKSISEEIRELGQAIDKIIFDRLPEIPTTLDEDLADSLRRAQKQLADAFQTQTTIETIQARGRE